MRLRGTSNEYRVQSFWRCVNCSQIWFVGRKKWNSYNICINLSCSLIPRHERACETDPELQPHSVETLMTTKMTVTQIRRNWNGTDMGRMDMEAYNLHANQNYTDWSDWMNTNHQLVRGNYTARADSMTAGQIRGSQESLLWDKRTPCCRQTGEKTGETEAWNLGKTFVERKSFLGKEREKAVGNCSFSFENNIVIINHRHQARRPPWCANLF